MQNVHERCSSTVVFPVCTAAKALADLAKLTVGSEFPVVGLDLPLNVSITESS